MKNKFIAICFCLLALVITILLCDDYMKANAASENSGPYVTMYLPNSSDRSTGIVAEGYPEWLKCTDYGTVIFSIGGHKYETGNSNVIIRWY